MSTLLLFWLGSVFLKKLIMEVYFVFSHSHLYFYKVGGIKWTLERKSLVATIE